MSSREELSRCLRICAERNEPITKRNELIRAHAFRDIEFFARHFFPHLCRLPFSPMHRELFLRRTLLAGETLPDRPSHQEALAAPRGYAKSTIKSLILPLHDVCYDKERYITLFSATLPQAELRLKNLRREAETNARLRAVYADQLRRNGSRNRRALNLGGARIEAWSAGSEARGVTYGQWRPTRIILDDIEDSEEVENAEKREQIHDWFREVIENLGDSYTRIDIVGTILHPESLLRQILDRTDYESTRWKAILRFANDQNLWEEWRRIYTNADDPRRQSRAWRYYNSNKSRMLEGAKVLWPEKEDYYQCMKQLAARGRRAFFKEKQNEPLRSDAAVFDVSTFRYFRRVGSFLRDDSGQEICRLENLRIYGFLDSAMGRNRRSDYAAIATIGKDKHERIYVLDCWLERATPSEQARRVFDQHAIWSYDRFGIEATGFQGLIAEPLESERKRRRRAGDPCDLILSEIEPRGSKIERVAALEPLAHNGILRFERALGDEFFAQIEHFPRGRHDDGPDALAAAVELARSNGGSMMKTGKSRRMSKAF